MSTSFKKEIIILSHVAKKVTGPAIFAKLLVRKSPFSIFEKYYPVCHKNP